MAGATLAAPAPAFASAGDAAAAFDVLQALAIILSVAAATTVLFQRLRQPVVLGYLLAGLIVGPHLKVPLFADEHIAHTLSELGVILLMFSLGLEFSLRKLIKVAGTAGIVAVLQCSLMMVLGVSVGRAFGWTTDESLFAGAMLAISSTTIIVKAFAEQRQSGRLAEIVFGILIVEDLIAVLLLAVLTAVASGAGLSAGALARTLARLAGFLVVLLVAGMAIIPRFVRFVSRLDRRETTTVACVGVCFALALLARYFGYSVALGAFLAGALVAESGESARIEPLVEPLRDVFGAVFFVSVGMLIDPKLVAEHIGAVVALTGVVVLGKVLGVTVGAFLAGYGVRTSVQAGMSLAQIGEFSFIIAGVGLSLGATRSFLYPVAVAVSALTTLLTPWLIRVSGRVASGIDRRLPRPVAAVASLYGAWVERLLTPGPDAGGSGTWPLVRRRVSWLAVDVSILAALVVGAALGAPHVARLFDRYTSLEGEAARAVWIAAVIVAAAPFALGAVRSARGLGLTLAQRALPPAPTGLDLAAAPRRALLVSLQIGILLLAGVPLVAITEAFVPALPGPLLLVACVAVLALQLWRQASNLQGHMRAGAEVVLEALARQSHATEHAPASASTEVQALLPGLGESRVVPITADAPAVGKSLRDLGVRALTGATVVVIERAAGERVHPTADEVLLAGDRVVLTGTREAADAAVALLTGRAP